MNQPHLPDNQSARDSNVPDKATEDLIEKLAAIEHARWASWQRWVMNNRCTVNSFGDYIIKAEDAEHWLKQCATPYLELTENEKQSDRDQVERYLPLIQELVAEAIGEDEEHGSGANVAWEASVDYRNQLRAIIRNRLEQAGLLKGEKE